jgi:hypothetical protein
MISSCISDMSMRYEVMGLKFSKKLEDLETTSMNLQRKVEALQHQRRDTHADYITENDDLMNAPTIDATNTVNESRTQTTIKKGFNM